MARQVKTAPIAAIALEQARRWLLQPGSGREGARRWRALRDVSRALRDHPYLGRVMPEFAIYRQVIVSGHRVIYRVVPDTGDRTTAGDIEIVQVFGLGQDTRIP